MAAMEDKNLKVGDGSGDYAKQDYLRVACALRDRLRDVTRGVGDGVSVLAEILEIAAHEFGIKRDDDGKSKKRRKKPRVELIMGSERAKEGCEHSCRDHKELMNPGVWENLPPELLQLVFSHLPVVEISRLKLLNKHWQHSVSVDSGFHGACREVYPKMVGLITADYHNLFWVRVLDLNCSKWYTYKIKICTSFPDGVIHFPPSVIAMCEDGGLVCFVTCWKIPNLKVYLKRKSSCSSLQFSVINPLTRTSHFVPTLSGMQKVRLVRIQVDRRTKEFKLFVTAQKLVWTNFRTGWVVAGFTAQVYDSQMGVWTTADECLSSSAISDMYAQRVVYNFANGRLFTMDHESLSRTGKSFALYKESLFVLKLGADGPANDAFVNQSPTYFIEEFHWDSAVWVKVKTHRCEPFEHPPKTNYFMRLRACNGVLMVTSKLSKFSFYNRVNERFGKQLAWLYNLSTMKWSILDLPHLPVGGRVCNPYDHSYQDASFEVDLMFEPQWGI